MEENALGLTSIFFSNIFPDLENEMSKETSDAIEKSDDDDHDDIEIIPAKRRKNWTAETTVLIQQIGGRTSREEQRYWSTDVSAEDSKDAIKFFVSHSTVEGEIIIISDDE